MDMNVFLLTATCGRHHCIERSVGLFLDQDYTGLHTQIIFNNSDTPQELDLPKLPENKRVILINSCYYKYSTLGEIYNSILRYIPENVDVISMLDDDDIILPDHISEGVKGYKRALGYGKLAYKPSHSYYRGPEGISLVSNTLEPSIFVTANIIKGEGFHNTTSDQHLKWVDFLTRNDIILVDPNGKPTLIYNWGDTDIPTWKTSGDPNNPHNFTNYREFSKDHGDKIITPERDLSKYYNEIKNKL